MKKTTKKIICVMSASLCASVMASCSANRQGSVSEGNKITYWVPLSANTAQTVSNLAETPFAKALMEKFDCVIEYQHPAQGQESEKFNVMVAAGKLPDIVEYSWNSSYPGGSAKALADGVIREIDIVKDAPNLNAYIEANPDLRKMIKTDDGKYYGYPFIRGDEYLLTSAGMIVREDWLQDLGLEYPETIDEWTTMLRAFKNEKGAKAPLSMTPGVFNLGFFVGAYNVADGLYIDGNTVKYGPIEDSYKAFLAQMNAWYKEGLFDANYVSLNNDVVQSNILNGVSGATFGSCGSGIGKWLAAKPNDKYNLAGVKAPVLNKGDVPQFGHYQFPVTNTIAVISKDCEDKELCAKLLDYGYGEEGQLLFNFGIEGESYNTVSYTHLEHNRAWNEGYLVGAYYPRRNQYV